MNAFIPADWHANTIGTLDALRAQFERRRTVCERFARHAAEIGDRDVTDHFTREAKVWAEAIDALAERIQLESGR